MGDAQCHGTDVRGPQNCRRDYPSASDGHRDPHRACVARSSRFIGPCACLTRLTILPDRATRFGSEKRLRDKKDRGSIEEPLPVLELTCSHHLPDSAALGEERRVCGAGRGVLIAFRKGTRFSQNRLLCTIQVYEIVLPVSMSELRSRFDWSTLCISELNTPGQNHGILPGTKGWAPQVIVT